MNVGQLLLSNIIWKGLNYICNKLEPQGYMSGMINKMSIFEKKEMDLLYE